MPVNPAPADPSFGPSQPGPTDPAQVVILPDDAPSLAHTKIGPLGTINKAVPAASTAKKKSKAKPPAPTPGPPPLDGDMPPGTPGPLPPPPLMHSSSTGATIESKKGKNAGTPSKKKTKVEPFPPVVMASA